MPAINDLTSLASLERYLTTDKLLLIDFWAPWCTSCKAMLPSIESIVAEKADAITLLKINLERFPELTERFSVRVLPSVVLYQQQQELLRITELQTPSQLKQRLAPWLNFEYLALIQQAQATADHQQALTILATASRLAPQQIDVHLAYLERLLRADQQDCWQHALAYVQGLDHQIARDPEISRVQSYLNLTSQIEQHSNALQPVLALLLEQDYVQALDRLSVLAEQENKAEFKELIVKILNVMPDRKAAHDQRLKLYNLIK